MGISNMTLVKIGAIGGIVTVSMGFALRNKLSNNVKDTDYYKDAMKTLRTNRGAVYILGEPIKDRTVDVSDSENNFTRGDVAQYQVPVSGSKKRGTMYMWATKENRENWVVSRIELGLDDEPNRQLLIKKLVEDV